MGTLARIKRKYIELRGKTEEKWPINIRVYRDAGGGKYFLSQETRARSAEEKDDLVKLEFRDLPLESTEVPYNYFVPRKDNSNELEVVRHTRTSFSPLKHEIRAESGNYEETIEKVYDLEEMKRTAIDDFEQKAKVVENDDKAFYEEGWFAPAVIFIMTGIFIVMTGIGINKVVSEPVLEAVDKLEKIAEDIEKGLIPLAALHLRRQDK